MVRLAARDWVPGDATPDPNLPVLNTVKVLVPRAAMRCSTARVEPVPTATKMMTAETPMSTPSMVSKERSLLEVTPPSAMRITSRWVIGTLLDQLRHGPHACCVHQTHLDGGRRQSVRHEA